MCGILQLVVGEHELEPMTEERVQRLRAGSNRVDLLSTAGEVTRERVVNLLAIHSPPAGGVKVEWVGMVQTAYDPDALLLVSVISGPRNTDDDFERAVAAGARLATDATRRGELATLVMVVDSDQERPNAAWRKKLAQTEQQTPRLRSALVTESAIARGVITAIHWLSGTRDTLKRSTHERLADAVAALEAERGYKLPQIRQLYAAALADITAASRRAAGAGRGPRDG